MITQWYYMICICLFDKIIRGRTFNEENIIFIKKMKSNTTGNINGYITFIKNLLLVKKRPDSS